MLIVSEMEIMMMMMQIMMMMMEMLQISLPDATDVFTAGRE